MDESRSVQAKTSKETAERLGCTVQHVRLLVKKGQLDGRLFGRDWLIEEESISRLMENRYNRKSPKVIKVREPQVESLFPEAELQSIVNVATVPQRSPFRYPGGKTWLIPIARKWLSSLQGVSFLVEPFAGGGGISLVAALENYVRVAILVELDPDVAAVWHVLVNGQGPDLAQLILGFDLQKDTVESALASKPSTVLEKAFCTIIKNRVSRGGILAPGAGLVKTGEAGRGIRSRWYPETLANRIENIHASRHKLQFLEADGLAVMKGFEAESDRAYFIDPPYPIAGKRLYRYFDLDHRNLFEQMSKLRGPFLATYDDNPDIANLAEEFGFSTRLIPMKSTHHQRKMELLISRSFDWLPSEVSGQAA